MVQFTYNSKSLYATSRWKKNLKNQPQNLHNKSISFLRAIEINKRSRKQRSFDRIGWTKSGNPCPIERFDGYRSHVGTIRAGYKFPRVDQFKYAWGTHGGKKKKKKEKAEGKRDRQARRGWLGCFAADLVNPYRRVSRRKWRRQTSCRRQQSCSHGLSRRVISFCQRDQARCRPRGFII